LHKDQSTCSAWSLVYPGCGAGRMTVILQSGMLLFQDGPGGSHCPAAEYNPCHHSVCSVVEPGCSCGDSMDGCAGRTMSTSRRQEIQPYLTTLCVCESACAWSTVAHCCLHVAVIIKRLSCTLLWCLQLNLRRIVLCLHRLPAFLPAKPTPGLSGQSCWGVQLKSRLHD
jgi:hypothetical protein